jgi:hypothetical protein
METRVMLIGVPVAWIIAILFFTNALSDISFFTIIFASVTGAGLAAATLGGIQIFGSGLNTATTLIIYKTTVFLSLYVSLTALVWIELSKIPWGWLIQGIMILIYTIGIAVSV